MSDSKHKSPMVQSVLALDEYFQELERLGNKINSLEMKSDFDFEHAQRLMNRFAECGQLVSNEVINLSNSIADARARAEGLAQGVAERAHLLNDRKTVEQQKMEEFRLLGEKVRELTAALTQFRRPADTELTDEDRQEITHGLSILEGQLEPLIDQAQNLKKEAQLSKMKILESNAEALSQTLQAVRQKLNSLNLPKSH